MDLEKEEENKIISDEENDNELLQKFSKHKNNNLNNINKKDIFIKCSFDEKTIEQNKQLLSQYEKSGLIKTDHYFSLDKEELDDPIDPKKIKREKNNFYLFENNVENSDLYCGYMDHMDLQKIKNKDKSIISCPFCFCLISNNILENKTELGYIIIGKSKYIFKDFSSDIINSEEAKKLFKDNKGIKNYEKEKEKKLNKNMNNDIEKEEEKDNKNEIQNGLNKKMDIEIDIDKENKEEEILNIKDNKYIIISCINCGNIIGLCDAFDNTKIILDYL
jgi:hypothetical protein